MEKLPLETLQKSDYPNIDFKGSLKQFYSMYNYKVKLSNNNIDPNSDNRPLYSWFGYSTSLDGESSDERLDRVWKTKFVNSFTRHAYFVEKAHLDKFVKEFKDIIIEVQGPISEDHVQALETVGKQGRNDFEKKVIRDRLYYQKFDSKITFVSLQTDWRNFSKYTWQDIQQHYEKLQNYVEDILGENNVQKSYNNVYLRKEDLKEVAMYMKLKYPDAIKDITEVIVIENLNNR